VGLGIGAAILTLPVALLSLGPVAAMDLPPGAYQATGFYERTAIGREALVAVVLVPPNGTMPPVIQDGTDLVKRDLGSAPMETFSARVGGMEQKVLFDHGALRAVVYSAKTIDGAYVQEKRYLVGRSELDIENPRLRVQKTEGAGGHSGGNGGGGGSGGGGM
ncbi:MAG TPA: hypothetical protein VEU07_12570, partial [Candidatus Acidoferrum sp.]|nr:hypothetical protein [Candidatus Acidoferrum sp.]